MQDLQVSVRAPAGEVLLLSLFFFVLCIIFYYFKLKIVGEYIVGINLFCLFDFFLFL